MYVAYFVFAASFVCQPWVPESAGQLSYLRRITLSINQTLNTILFGQPDETISSRIGRTRATSRFSRGACWVLDRIDPCHCFVAAEIGADGRPEPHQFYIGEGR